MIIFGDRPRTSVAFHVMFWPKLAGHAESDPDFKFSSKYKGFYGDIWCCRTGLNCRPLPYQGSALPLSYGSRPRRESAQRARQGGRSFPQGPPSRKPRAPRDRQKRSRSGSRGRGPRIRSFRCHHDQMNYRQFPSAGIGLFLPRFETSNVLATMTDEGDGRERQAGASAKNSGKALPRKDSKPDARQDRLKLALRENLKRRKSQARG